MLTESGKGLWQDWPERRVWSVLARRRSPATIWRATIWRVMDLMRRDEAVFAAVAADSASKSATSALDRLTRQRRATWPLFAKNAQTSECSGPANVHVLLVRRKRGRMLPFGAPRRQPWVPMGGFGDCFL